MGGDCTQVKNDLARTVKWVKWKNHNGKCDTTTVYGCGNCNNDPAFVNDPEKCKITSDCEVYGSTTVTSDGINAGDATTVDVSVDMGTNCAGTRFLPS